MMIRAIAIGCTLFTQVSAITFSQEFASFDVIVYGGTSAGVSAAVQAKRMGKSVAIVCPDKHLGGLSSGGLGWTDTGNKEVIGGLSREFYHRVWKIYDRPETWKWQRREEYGNKGQGTPAVDGQQRTMWIFEPSVAQRAFEELVAEYQIPVLNDQWLDRSPGQGVEKKNGRIHSIKMVSGKVFRGKMFIDATYEGDLMAAAGVEYHVGREASSVYNEMWNGVQVGTLHHRHWFMNKIDPYVKPGDPTSGLLPRISPAPPGIKGEADIRIQAYCYRMCLTDDPRNKISFAKPDGYDPAQYGLLARVFASGWREMFDKFDPIPNKKTDTNNHGPFSTDNIGLNYDYPEASYERRKEILREHQQYQKGLMYFMANDPSVPEDVRSAVSKWGYAKDEFTDSGGWPHQIYVREARRMIGQYVMTELDCLDQRDTPDSVGMGSYTVDSHNVQRYVTPEGYVQNEGDIGVGTPRPYEIAYGSLTPKKVQCENLLVPVCLSCSHIAFGSIRMEPVFMILGHSAAAAACLSIDTNLAVQDLPYSILRTRLIADGQVLQYAAKEVAVSAKLTGIVVDDREAKFFGSWTHSSASHPFHGQGYQHDGHSNQGKLSARFVAALKPGQYEVRLAYASHANRASNVPATVTHAGGTAIIKIDQRKPAPIDGITISLGTFRFGETGIVSVSNDAADGYVVVDAVQFLPK